jgi:host factor-I protein
MIQDQFLAALKKNQVVTIYLISGIRLQGTVESSDQYGLLLAGNSQQFIFKSAISTIVPSREVDPQTRLASAHLPRSNPILESSSADKPSMNEIVAEKKEASTIAPVVRVKRASAKFRLANSEQDQQHEI